MVQLAQCEWLNIHLTEISTSKKIYIKAVTSSFTKNDDKL